MTEDINKAIEFLKMNSKSHKNSNSKEYGHRFTATKYFDESGDYIGRIHKIDNKVSFVCVEASNYASNIIGSVFNTPKPE